MTPIRVTLGLTLMIVVVLLAAGCVTFPGFDNQTQIFSKEKYVFIEHHINMNGVTVYGECAPPVWIDFPMYFFDNNGVLTVAVHPNEPINESLILFYGSGKSLTGVAGQGASTSAVPVYSLPKPFFDSVTLDSITEDGTVSLHYNNELISLKPNESWVNTSHVIENREPPYHATKCTAEIITTDSIRNAGFFDKRKIVSHVMGGS